MALEEFYGCIDFWVTEPVSLLSSNISLKGAEVIKRLKITLFYFEFLDRQENII